MSGPGPGFDAVIWVADGLVADGLDYGSRLADRLAARGLRVVRQDMTSPDAVPAARLHVLSGGATSVNDRSGWMPRGLAVARSLIEAARRGDHTVLGICLGAQMIAEVLWPGGVRAAEQIEVGLTEVQWSEPGRERTVVPAFHFEEVVRSTVDAGGGEVVAANVHSSVRGFRSGATVCGLQFHPEFEPADMRRLVMHHRRTIEAHGGTVDAALRSVDRLEARWTRDLFDRVFHRMIECRPHGTTVERL